MKVLKFGGTSVGSIENLKNVKSIVESSSERQVVVVSALGGLTDKLIATAHAAAEGKDYATEMQQIRLRHKQIIDSLVPNEHRRDVNIRISTLLDQLEETYGAIAISGNATTELMDRTVSFGEMCSSTIIAQIIEKATWFDSRQFIKTNHRFGRHILDAQQTERLLKEQFTNRDWHIALVPGFIASDSNDCVTNLGRGGSDFTAAIIAAALNADVLEIWTDVDGFMTSDPRKISHAQVIESLTYIEAMELCDYGAKVIYPPTIYPVFHKHIPIYIKNTFNPSAPGTLIADDERIEQRRIKGISSVNDVSLVTITGHTLASVPGHKVRVFNSIARNGIAVLMSSSKPGHTTMELAVAGADGPKAYEALSNEFADELQLNEISNITLSTDLSVIAAVGENMRHANGLRGSLRKHLQQQGIDVVSISAQSSETNISVAIPSAQRQRAMQVLHDALFH